MKPVTKKEEGQVSGGVVTTTVVEKTWPTPAPFPTEPCSPVVNDPLADLKESTR